MDTSSAFDLNVYASTPDEAKTNLTRAIQESMDDVNWPDGQREFGVSTGMHFMAEAYVVATTVTFASHVARDLWEKILLPVIARKVGLELPTSHHQHSEKKHAPDDKS
ncbi:MAG: hypothetical protein ACLQVD_01075 [Capsulimonadaceae bacterium]